MTEHIDLDVLADLDEGLLDAGMAASVRSHVDNCATCQATQGTLKAVTEVLSAQPPPVLPEAIIARLDAALAAEYATLHESDMAAETAPPHTPTVVPLRRNHRGRLLAAAATLCVLVGGGFGLAAALHPGGKASTASAPAAPSGASGVSIPTAGAGIRSLRSGAAYTAANLTAEVNRLVKRGSTGSAMASEPGGRPLALQPDLAGCIENFPAATRPIVVDESTYEGKAAAIIVYPAGSGGYDVVIVAAGCSGTNRNVLRHTTVPKLG